MHLILHQSNHLSQVASSALLLHDLLNQTNFDKALEEKYKHQAKLAVKDSYNFDFLELGEEYDERRKVLIHELSKIENLKVSKPKGAFYCIAELPVKDADKFAQWMLEEFSHNNESVMVAPASGFYSTQGSGKNQIRIAYVLNKESLIRSVELIKLALEQYKD